jgi:nicotinate-nucleotide adenylyltransferase
MKIGLYFGSFNPIHTGHCIIASHVLNNTDLKQVWFIISPQNPFKVSSSLLNEYHRFHLVQTAIQGEVSLKASDIEFQLPKPSYTASTLTYLAEKYPQHSFSIIMGSDSFQNLSRWKNASYIIQNYEIFVYLRPGFPVENSIGAKLVLLNAPLLEISATLIRENLKQKKSIRYLVPDNVKEEIERNGYYKT